MEADYYNFFLLLKPFGLLPLCGSQCYHVKDTYLTSRKKCIHNVFGGMNSPSSTWFRLNICHPLLIINSTFGLKKCNQVSPPVESSEILLLLQYLDLFCYFVRIVLADCSLMVLWASFSRLWTHLPQVLFSLRWFFFFKSHVKLS